MNINQNNKLKQSLIDFSESSPMREVCGFICLEDGDLVLQKATNHSSDDGFFLISPFDFLERKLSGGLVAIFHSHVDSNEDPSELDKKNSLNCLYPFLIYSLETENFCLFDRPHFERSEKCVNDLREIMDD
jgi:proteasome lid subunit RPN8/RPN11|tara:strand:- start:77 stop:469 length:393 start_codon:yes stop_codon:yes gene_type:complete